MEQRGKLSGPQKLVKKLSEVPKTEGVLGSDKDSSLIQKACAFIRKVNHPSFVGPKSLEELLTILDVSTEKEVRSIIRASGVKHTEKDGNFLFDPSLEQNNHGTIGNPEKELLLLLHGNDLIKNGGNFTTEDIVKMTQKTKEHIWRLLKLLLKSGDIMVAGKKIDSQKRIRLFSLSKSK